MGRVLLRPRWLALHVLVTLVVVLFVGLGLWQVSRHVDRQAYNALVTERAQLPAEPVAAVLGHGQDDAAYRRVTATGVYRTDEELLLTGRSLDGRPGHHVLTPLEGPDGVLLVDRGWVPFALDTPPVPEAAPPDGAVTVTGLLLPDEGRVPLAGTAAEPAPRLTRVDLERIDRQVAGDLAPLWLRLSEQSPSQPGVIPRPVGLPPLEDGPHLAYAGQWFLFALVGLVGYPFLLRRQSAEAGLPAHAAGADPSHDHDRLRPLQ